MAMLNKDPAYLAQKTLEEKERAEREAAFASEEAPLIAELNSLGVNVSRVSDLINKPMVYTAAIPKLVHHLSLNYSDAVRDMIARALGVKEARRYWSTIVSEYRRTPLKNPDGSPNRTKDGLAAAIAIICTPETLEQLIELVEDKTLGESRILLLRVLRKSKNPRAKNVLEKLEFDSELATEIGSWSKKSKSITKN